jgi:hypothetical protein
MSPWRRLAPFIAFIATGAILLLLGGIVWTLALS